MGFLDIFKQKKQQDPLEGTPEIQDMLLAIFPGGTEQIEKETAQLSALLRGILTNDDALKVLVKTKALLLFTQDKSEETVTDYILNEAGGQLTAHQAKLAYQFFTGQAGDLYSGGDGSSMKEAVVINATSSLAGVPAEYAWIEKHYGKRDVDWTLDMQSHGTTNNGKSWEELNIRLNDGTGGSICFDISSFYGRF